ncbi:MAG: peptidylprolyl isomerase [Thermodesulfobacteriota bacterium]
MRYLSVLFISLLLVGCNSSTDNVEETNHAENIDDSEIIVQIGTDGITKNELNEALDKISIKQKAIYTSSPEKFNEFLENLINQKVLYNEAYKRGIESRDDVQKKIYDYKKKLVAKTFGKEILNEIEPSNEEIKEHYENNKDDYQTVDISKIEIKFIPNDQDSRASAQLRAQEIFERIESGESFEELAKEYSTDQYTKGKGGKIGSVEKGRFPSEIDAALFELKKEDVTKPFELDGAYLIIKANSDPDFLPYAQSDRRVRSKLVEERLFDYIADLKEQWEVKIYEDRLEEIYKSESDEK